MPMIFAIVWFPLGIAWIACLGGRLGRPMNAIWGRGPAVQAPPRSPCGRWSVALGDRDQRRAQQLLVEHEPLLADLGPRLRRDAASLAYAHENARAQRRERGGRYVEMAGGAVTRRK